LGKYTERPEGIYIDRRLGTLTDGDKVYAEGLRTRGGDREFSYFQPGYECDGRICGPDAEDIRAMTEDYKRMESYSRGDWQMLGIVVKMTVNGREAATDSVWGNESDGGDDYLMDCALELARDQWAGRAKVIAELETKASAALLDAAMIGGRSYLAA